MRIEVASNDCTVAKLKQKEKGVQTISVIDGNYFIEVSVERLVDDSGGVIDVTPEIFVSMYDNLDGQKGTIKYRYFMPVGNQGEEI
jgi:hypothetical protein